MSRLARFIATLSVGYGVSRFKGYYEQSQRLARLKTLNVDKDIDSVRGFKLRTLLGFPPFWFYNVVSGNPLFSGYTQSMFKKQQEDSWQAQYGQRPLDIARCYTVTPHVMALLYPPSNIVIEPKSKDEKK